MDGFIQLFSEYDVPAAFLVNIELTLWSALFSLILGVVLVMMRISPISSLRTVAGAYVELFKNLPLTIIMVFMVLGAYAQLKLTFSDTFVTNFFWLAVTGLSLYTAAFVCESLRSGINTVPIGQAEAARALGLGFMQSATQIILPQAFRGSVAPLGNTLIALLKNSTVAAAASVATETSSLMSTMIEFHPDVIVQIFLIFAFGYVILIIPIGMLTTYLSNKLAVRRRRHGWYFQFRIVRPARSQGTSHHPHRQLGRRADLCRRAGADPDAPAQPAGRREPAELGAVEARAGA